MDSSQSTSIYNPDFSDMCSEDSTFWDFLRTDGKRKDIASEKQNPKDNLWKFSQSSLSSNTPSTGNEAKDISSEKQSSLDNFWYFLESSTSINTSSTGNEAKESTAEKQNPTDNFWNFLESSTSIDTSSTGNEAKESTAEKQTPTDNFWYFLESSTSINAPSIGNEAKRQTKVHHNQSVQNLLESNSNLKVLYEKSENSVSEHNKIGSCNTVNRRTRTCTEDVTKENEDEFWDFLKSDNPTWKTDKSDISRASLSEFAEEITKLSALTSHPKDISSTSSNNEFLKYNAQVPDLKNDQNFNDILHNQDNSRDLDAILSEINSTVQELGKRTIRDSQEIAYEQIFATKDLEIKNATQKACPKNPTAKFAAPNKSVINRSETGQLAVNIQDAQNTKSSNRNKINSGKNETKFRVESNIQNVPHNCAGQRGVPNVKQNKNPSSKIQLNSRLEPIERNQLSPTKTFARNDLHLITATGNSEVSFSNFNLQSKSSNNANTKFGQYETEKFDQFESEQFSFLQSDFQPATEVQNSTNLPVISSIFSISSCSDIFHQKDIPTEKRNTLEQNISVGISTKDTVIDTIDHNLVPSRKSDSLSPTSNPLLEQNATCSSNVKGNIFPNALRKQKSAKRMLPRSSPKNSVFKITDCDSGGNTQQYAEAVTLTNATEPKRQKTCDSLSNLNIVYPNTSNLKDDLQYQSRVPVKNVETLPNVFEVNNSTVSNPVSLYLIIPKNTESGQNAEFVMLVNNNTIASNSLTKDAPNLVNPTIPVLPVTCAQNINTQVLGNTKAVNSKQQISVKKFQQISVPTVNLMALKDNIPSTNAYLQPTVICDPVYQSTGSEGTNVINSVSTRKTTMLSNASSQNCNNHSTMLGSTNIDKAPPIAFTNVPCLINNYPLPNITAKVNGQSLGGNTEWVSNIVQQPSQIVQTLSYSSVPQKRLKNSKVDKLKPIKSIAIGKDKNAIQQTSFPLKMENVLAPVMYGNYDNLGNHVYYDNCNLLTEPATNYIVKDINTKVIVSQENKLPVKQENISRNSKVIDFIPFKPKAGSVLIKRDLIRNTREVVNKNQMFKQHSSQLPILKSMSSGQNSEFSNKISDSEIKYLSNTDQINQITQLETDIEVKGLHCKEQYGSQGSCNSEALKSFNEVSKSQTVTVSSDTDQQKSALATLQELFPPPISMIPVCVVQTAPASNKPTVSKVLVLHDANPALLINKQTQASNSNASRKTCPKKTTMKIKKAGRKTVRELLQEHQQNTVVDRQFKVYQPRTETKILKPVSKLPDSRLLIPTVTVNKTSETVSGSTQNTGLHTNVFGSSSKRPNIMILPSASKITQENSSKEVSSNKTFHQDNSAEEPKPQDNIFDIPKDFLSFSSPMDDERLATLKDYRPKHYDMCELSIGYFKVEDDVDACGRFRSKFKILFTKRQFLYDFPVVNCNQVDLNGVHVWNQMARILVPFKTIVAINAVNRRINIQVNNCPQIYLWKSLSRHGSISSAKGPNKVELDNSMWISAMRNSFIHKITLRKRQADSLKILLCQFEPKFLLLFSVNIDGRSIIDATPYEEELAAANLRKIQQKSKKAVIRRLPQWDSEYTFEPPVLVEEDPLFASNHVCSCRISCRSLRCSCVKAAKSCSTEGTVCSCTDCDNPLNVLESFGLHLEFSLSDCCLFQNIYQIPRLRNYLERMVKLSCCNTLARVLDCIPGTILCPNTECNASLEFSWCRGIICYPERNPRNHCSFCGQCCFSNGRHCPVCNRCYVVKPRSLNCPSCGANGVSEKPMVVDANLKNVFPTESPSWKHISVKKPEIIVLDKSSSASDNSLVKKKEAGLAEISVKSNSPRTLENVDAVKKETDLVKLDIDEKQTIGDETSTTKTEECAKSEESFRLQDEIKNAINCICHGDVKELKVEYKIDESFKIPLSIEKKNSEDLPTEIFDGVSFWKSDVSGVQSQQQSEVKDETDVKLGSYDDSKTEIVLVLENSGVLQ